ncbi:MAG: TRAP transporter large permease [Candidatus Adiutrix sp.]|jgi:C4-dicarboxylate transporter DctM subunit|nr:TRAP transporter large permease [Candidatus Adiutrix sp.]
MAATIFIAFFVLVVIGVPIAIALGLSSMITLAIHSHVPLMVLVQKAYSGLDTFTLMAIPFFILAGNVMSQGGVSSRLVALASIFFGRYTGGLAQVSTAACTFFGAISGSAPATTAAIGSVMVKPMEAKGYSKEFASACVAASGVIGLLIPPSINMVLYGVITGASIGKMFLGGIIPGIVMSAALMLANYYIAKKHGFMGETPPTGAQAKKAIRESFFAMLMPVIILGGIYAGIFTPTESAVVAAAYGLFVGAFIYKELTLKKLGAVIMSTAKSSAIIMVLVSIAHCFSYLLASEQIPQAIGQAMLSVSSEPNILLIMICISLLIVGTFLDNAVSVVLMTPILFPIIDSVGIDPVFFGVLMVLTLAIGQITPPVGLCLFVACNISGITIEKLSLAVIPYLLVMLVVMLIILFVPDLTLFIPNMVEL